MVITPQQRVVTSRKGLKPDKLPVFVAAANSFICQYYGISQLTYLNEPGEAAECQKSFINDFSIDGCVIASGYILYGCGPEIGVKWQFSDTDFPGSVEGPLKDKAPPESIKVPAEPKGYFKNYLDFIRQVTADLSSTHYITANILGPFATLCFLRGIENTLMDTMTDPVYFKRCLDHTTNFSIYFGRHVLSTGVPFNTLNEIFLTPQMIMPKTYQEIILPAIEAVQKALEPNFCPNIMGAFIGKPNDQESISAGRSLYNAFFGISESLDSIKTDFHRKTNEQPFPLSISGRMMDDWPLEKINAYLKQALDFLVRDNGVYPTINLISLQPPDRLKAVETANKIKGIIRLRDEYLL